MVSARLGRRTLRLLSVCGLVLVANCGDNPPANNIDVQQSALLQAMSVTVSVPLPPNTPLSSVALGANSTLIIGNNVSVVEEGSSSAVPMIVNAGAGTMSTAQTGDNLGTSIWSVGSVFLATGTSVAGSVTTGSTLTEQTGVTVGGPTLQNQSLTPVSTSLTVTYPASSAAVTLQPGQTSSISPGAFSSVTVNANATLTLSSGTYYVGSVDIEPSGKIVLNGAGPVVIDVQSSFMVKGQIVVPGTSPFIVLDSGTSDVFLQTEFDGTLIAPNANVTLAPSGSGTTSYHGAFFGKSLTLQPRVAVVHRAVSAGTVAPVAECVMTLPSGGLEAVFGYTSSSLLGNTTIPIGTNNQFEPAPTNRSQPTVFSPGRHTAQFAIPFDGHALVWKLDGSAATASALLPACTTACVQQFATPAQPRIDHVLSTAAVPLSIDESIVQRDAFRWADTLPVPETFSDGTPRLYYGLVYMNSQASLQTMDALRLNYDNVPMFDPEVTAFQQQGITTLSYPFDGQGEFAFTLLPGAAYNALRLAALDSTQPVELFQALQLRTMPAVDSQITVQTSCGLQPVAQCVAKAANGSLRAVFSYNNPAGNPVTVPAGPDNALTGAAAGTLPPEAFNNGTHTAVFAVPFTAGHTISWKLQGQTVSVGSGSPVCSTTIVNAIGVDHYAPFPPSAPATCRSPTPVETLYPTSQLPPAARVNTCNSLSYQYAGQLGFLWRGVASDADDAKGLAADAELALQDSPAAAARRSAASNSNASSGTSTVTSALFGKLFHKIVQAVAKTVTGAVDGVRRGLTTVTGLFLGSANITIQGEALNTDPFVTSTSQPTKVLQAWGANFGNDISLQGIQVRSQKSLFLSVGNMSSSNQASVKVLGRLGAHICFNLENSAAQMVDFSTLPLTVCPSNSTAQINTSTASPHIVQVADPNVNAMAQMTDAHLYMSSVAGVSINQAEALTGVVPNLLGALNGDRAFTPCWSFSWANDVGTFMTALGAVAADEGDQWVVNHLETGAKYVAKGVATSLTKAQQALTQLQAAAAAEAGTALAPLANAAVAAQNTLITQIQAAGTQAKLVAQNANDLVGSVGTAARLQAAGSTAATAAANTAQSIVNTLSPQVGPANTALQAAQTAAQTAKSDIDALLNALGSSDAVRATVQAADTAANVIVTSYVNYLKLMGEVLNDTQRIGVDTIGALIGNFIGYSPLGQIFEAFATGDILYPAHSSSGNLSERIIATHEYGHFVLCNLLDNTDAVGFAVAYDEAAASGFITGQSPSAAGSVMNEAFADLIASQVTGATDYAFPNGSGINSTSQEAFCLATDSTCIEANTMNADSQSFNDEVLRAVSLYTDAFDGRTFPPDANVPTNGNQWSGAKDMMGTIISVTQAGNPGLSNSDESVALTGSAFGGWMGHVLARGTLLREDSMFGGLSDTMIDQGYSWCQRCQVFQLHTQVNGQATCPAAWVGPRPTTTLSGMTVPITCSYDMGGCPQGTTPNSVTLTCDPTIIIE
jgi:hypothetical protein